MVKVTLELDDVSLALIQSALATHMMQLQALMLKIQTGLAAPPPAAPPAEPTP